MIDWVSSVMTIMLFVSHMSSSSLSCPEECHCYQDMNMFTANCTSLPTSNENIEVLNLIPKQQGQPLELSEGQFTGFKKLKYLNLSNCSIYNVHKKSFFGVKSLIELDLSYNNIHSLDSAVFQHITNLTSVVLRGNHFNFVSDDPFLISNTIERLDIGNCSITHLPPGVFYGVKRLKYIGLDKNQIKSLKYNSLPRSVMYLNLSNNLIVNVPTELLVSLKNLRRLDLSGNPINCTCPLMNVQDHLSGLGVIFDNEVICASPSQYAGFSWSQVNENELCITETLFGENIPIKYQRQQQKYKYQINRKHQISNNEKNNYFEANIQADQPYVDHLKQDPDSEILFQNDNTNNMGVKMEQEDEGKLEKQNLKDSESLKNDESNPEHDLEGLMPSKTNFPDEVVNKTLFDDVNADSENKMDPGNQQIVESYNQEIENPESTTQNVKGLGEDIEIDEETGEQNDGARVELESNIESKNSDKVQENKSENEGQETQTAKSELKQESELEKTVISDSKDHDQILGGMEAESHNKTEVISEIHENILDTEEKSEKEQIKKEIEVNESPKIHQEKDEIEITTVEVVSPIQNQNEIETTTIVSHIHNRDEVKDGHDLKEILTGENIKEKVDETEELIKDITTQDTTNKDVEIIEEAGKINISEKFGQLKVENVNEDTTNQNLDLEIVKVINETESVVVPVNVEIGHNIISENKSSNLKQEDGIVVKHEETEKPPVEITKSGVEIEVNKEEQNVTESEIVGIIENVVTEVAVKSENEHLENYTEGITFIANQNIEETFKKEHAFNHENQPDSAVITTTDSEITTMLESESKDDDGKVQGLEGNTINPVVVSDEPELKTTPSSMIDLETTTTDVIVDHNETHSNIPEETNIHVTTETVILETTIFDNDTISYPDTTIVIAVNQDSIPIIPETEQSPTEISSDIFPSNELNTSAVLGNIKQGEPDADDSLIGDKTLKETVPMEFEPAHVVLGCLVVLITVLVLVAIYKCTTEGKKPNRTPKDVESNRGTEMQDMASLLPKPNNEEPKIISKKYPDKAATSETINLIQDEKKDVPPVTKPTQENENSLNNNTPSQNKPSLNRTATPITINPSAPIQRTRVKVGIIPESIPRTPIFVQKSYNNGVTNG